jgi:hypothetical protein
MPTSNQTSIYIDTILGAQGRNAWVSYVSLLQTLPNIWIREMNIWNRSALLRSVEGGS